MSASDPPPLRSEVDVDAMGSALAALERLRQEILAKRRTGFLVIAAAVAGGAILGLALATREPVLGLVVGVAIVAIATLVANVVWFGPGRSLYRNSYKEHVITALTRAVADRVGIPVIASGGVGTLDHLVEGLTIGGADAVLAASLFHFGDATIAEAKAHLRAAGVPVRITVPA